MKNLNAIKGPKYRCEYMEGLVSCFGTKDCVTTLNGTAFSECNDEAVLLIAPSQIGAAFCEAYGTALSNCGEQPDSAECLQIVKIFNDVTAQEGQNCMSKPCADIVACVTASFGGIEFGIVKPTLCTNSCTWAGDGACDDGGPGSSYSLCALGTDCTDCGPR